MFCPPSESGVQSLWGDGESRHGAVGGIGDTVLYPFTTQFWGRAAVRASSALFARLRGHVALRFHPLWPGSRPPSS